MPIARRRGPTAVVAVLACALAIGTAGAQPGEETPGDEGANGETPSANARIEPGSVLLADDFSDGATGVLPAASPQPARYLSGYVDGEYMIRKVEDSNRLFSVSPDPSFTDAVVQVDVSLKGDVVGRVHLICRQSSGPSHYDFAVSPGAGDFFLRRVDAGRNAILTNTTRSAEIERGNVANHLELSCVGDVITASINGTMVTRVQDGTYREGRIAIGAGTPAGPGPDARFANLRVTR